jgi:ATP-dependent DNA helicase DinG
MSDADDCMRTKCPTYNKCFFYNARRRAARAQIVIANHSLLVADLAVRGETQNYTQSFVLPAYHRVIIDEAHHLEDVATEHFGGRVSRIGLVMLLRRLASPRTGEGLLRHLAATIHEGKYDLARELARDWMMQLAGPILELHRELNDAVEEAAERTAIGLDQLEGGPIDRAIEFRRRVTEEMLSSTFWSRDVRAPLLAVITAARPLLEAMRKLHEALEDAVAEETSDATAPLMELKAAAAKIERSVASIARFLGDEEGYCRWIEYRRTAPGRKPFVAYCSAPLSVAEEIRDRLLRRFRTVILTSATLTVERKFDYFLQQIGGGDSARLGLLGSTTLREGAPPAASVARRPMRELMLDSPFDFERQVYVGVPVNLPTPREPGYAAALSDFLASALRASRGRAFVLFTAYSLLNEVHSRIAPELEAEGYPCLKQGTTGRTLLTQAFRREVGSILFATSSFWEGVDVPGEALSCLALARLPFGIPTEPIQEARIEAMRARGEDPFSELIVPRAVIKFRQGFGRLIRRSDDRGAVLICDRRVATQGYGQKFLKSLPTSKVHVARAELVIEALEAFFADVAR